MLPWLSQTHWPAELKSFVAANAVDPTSPPRPATEDQTASIRDLGEAVGGGRRGDQLRSALYLAVGDLHASHELSQDDPSAIASLLHGVMHRREGDFGNSLYWFNRCRSIELRDAGEGYSPDGLTEEYQRAFDARGGQLKPRAGADVEAIAEASWQEWRAIVDNILA